MTAPASTPLTPYATLLGFTRYVDRTGPTKATFVGGLRKQRESRSGFNPHGQFVKALKADIAFHTGGTHLTGVVDVVKPRWRPLYQALAPGATAWLHSLGDPAAVELAQTRDALGDARRPARQDQPPLRRTPRRRPRRGGPAALRRGPAERGIGARHPAPDGPTHGRRSSRTPSRSWSTSAAARPTACPPTPSPTRSNAGCPAKPPPSAPSGPPPPNPTHPHPHPRPRPATPAPAPRDPTPPRTPRTCGRCRPAPRPHQRAHHQNQPQVCADLWCCRPRLSGGISIRGCERAWRRGARLSKGRVTREVSVSRGHAEPRRPRVRFRVFRVARSRGLLTRNELRSSAWRPLFRDVYADARIGVTHAIRCAAVGRWLVPTRSSPSRTRLPRPLRLR